jgi:hypothetical protein
LFAGERNLQGIAKQALEIGVFLSRENGLIAKKKLPY